MSIIKQMRSDQGPVAKHIKGAILANRNWPIAVLRGRYCQLGTG